MLKFSLTDILKTFALGLGMLNTIQSRDKPHKKKIHTRTRFTLSLAPKTSPDRGSHPATHRVPPRQSGGLNVSNSRSGAVVETDANLCFLHTGELNCTAGNRITPACKAVIGEVFLAGDFGRGRVFT